ncbi:uncharacterized protein VNE69_12168 [Vairimorpha necatrix]|uniref:Uncharacterized protein n=1 Tax=Vairimorpha necatrix TaxID=6039 RepID=A0AAX4JHZ9_9MICR
MPFNTSNYPFKRPHEQNKDDYSPSVKRICNKILTHLDDSNEENERNATFKTDYDLSLKELQDQICDWKQNDQKTMREYVTIVRDKCTEELKIYFDRRIKIYRMVSKFRSTIKKEILINKIKKYIKSVSTNDKQKELLYYNFDIYINCYNFIASMTPNQTQRYLHESPIVISIYKKLINRLDIIFNKFKILSSFENFKLNLEKIPSKPFTKDELLGLKFLEEDFRDLFKNLSTIYEYSLEIIKSLTTCREKYGIKMK